MDKSRKIPRKLKKQLRKQGCIDEYGESIIHCLCCQKRLAVCGYNMLFCERCDKIIDEKIKQDND